MSAKQLTGAGPRPSRTPRSFAAAATAWYRGHARALPWREPGTSPWAVLVSEVMLQQTPVARVLPTWRYWLERWPSPAALAAEPAGAAIRGWGRLGYPRRALRLHECAGVIVGGHHGLVPSTVEDLLTLPGVGTYTAHAVAAFAFGQRHPVVDTNVRRLVARAVDGTPQAGPATTARDLAVVAGLLPVRPAAAAQASAAFMELGALICPARAPRCGECPLRTRCAWRRTAAVAGGRGPGAGPVRSARRSPGYAGTDRQVRGLLLAVLRSAPGPVPRSSLDPVWPEQVQRQRALQSLLADGLICEQPHGMYAFPV